MKTKQLNFLQSPIFKGLNRREHGGLLSQGRRKTARPMNPKLPLHVVLKSKRAQADWSMLRVKHEKRVKHLVYALARRFQVRIYRYANGGDHLHLLIKAKSKETFQAYLRALTGTIARAITGAKKGVKKGKFWDALAYSRIVTWGAEFKNVTYYVIMNELESLGIWSRKLQSNFKEVHTKTCQPLLR